MKCIFILMILSFFLVRCTPAIVGRWHVVIDSFSQYPDPVQYHVYPGKPTDSFIVHSTGNISIMDSAGTRTLLYTFKTNTSFITSTGIVQGTVFEVSDHSAYVFLTNDNGIGAPHSISEAWRYHLER